MVPKQQDQAGSHISNLPNQDWRYLKGNSKMSGQVEQLPGTADFLDSLQMEFYFRDVVAMLLKNRSEKPLEFMCLYFQR